MDRRSEVLAALRASEGAPVSGETLAASLGISRAAIGKHVSSLRSLGYEIEAAPGAGYRLVAVPDAPLPDEVAAYIEHPMWTNLTGGGPTTSTNDDAKAAARDGAPEGTVVLASEQRSGRGRLGRVWESPPGGAYLSAILRPNSAIAEVPPLALVAALGVALGLERLGAVPALKWPNDVLLSGGKFAGVLLETSAEADRAEWVVVGCGLNVRLPAGGRADGAAYLVEHVADVEDVSPARAAAAVLDGIAEAYVRFRDGSFAAVAPDFAERHALTGQAVTVSDVDGRALASGVVSGIDEWGRLVLGTADGPVALAAGEVTLG